MSPLDGALRLWFLLTAASLVVVIVDLIAYTPATTVMKWGWTLVVAYTGPVGLVMYLLSCREPLRGTHDVYVAPLWKQGVGSTIHCVAGDATGIILGALVGSMLAMPPVWETAFEYATGFLFGLLIFQALFMRVTMRMSYVEALRRSLIPEWLSMNAVMGGMIPVMTILMRRDMKAMDPHTLSFWGAMSAAILVGSITAYPINVWLVARRLKHGMGSMAVLGRGGDSAEHGSAHRVGRARIAAASAGTLAMLAAGTALAAL